MSLHVLADHMASKGRNGDSMLVHMTPGEVAGLHALALKHGGELTINPDTGLPEANFLKSLLPMLAGVALNFFVPGLGAAVGGAFGLGAAAGTGIAVGGLTTLATGSLSRGLMAGLGAYGGAGLMEGLMGAGAGTAAGNAAALGVEGAATGAGSQAAMLAEQNAGFGAEGLSRLADSAKGAIGAAPSTSGMLSAGFDAASKAPGAFLKNNLGYLAAAASPMMADMMVPTTTKMPEAQNPGYIRQKVFDPVSQTYRDLTPIKANEFKDRSFSDIYRGYNGGGIVALAPGGVAGFYGAYGDSNYVGDLTGDYKDAEVAAYIRDNNLSGSALDNKVAAFNITPDQLTRAQSLLAPSAPNASSVSDASNAYKQAIQANPNAVAGNAQTEANMQAVLDAYGGIGRKSIGSTANTIDQQGYDFWLNALNNGTLTKEDLNKQFGSAVNKYVTQTPDDAYADYVQKYVVDKYALPTGTAEEFLTGTRNVGLYDQALADALEETKFSLGARQGLTSADIGNPLNIAENYGGLKGVSSNINYYVDNYVANTANTTKTGAQKRADLQLELAKYKLNEDDVIRATGKTIAELFRDAEIKKTDTIVGDTIVGDTIVGDTIVGDTVAGGTKLSTGDTVAGGTKLSTGDTVAGGTKLSTATTYDNGAFGNYGSGNKTGVDYLGRVVSTATPGDIITNTDRTRTITPNIPGRPYGGFTGMDAVKSAYTAGGGSLGYTPRVVNSADQHDELYNRFTPGGDSEAAYNYLMGKGGAKYPTKSRVGQIATPYRESVMGYAPSTNKAYNYDAATGKMVRNMDYVAPGRDAAGNVNYSMSLNEMKKYLTANPLSGQALYDWAQSNGASAQDIADATGRKLSEVYAEFRDAAKKAADVKKTTATTETIDYGVGGKEGGLMGYSVGGGLGTLGGYSDGGRLLKGPGDGVSDSIPATIGAKQQPARLADGEFVVPARIVSELGNGSTDAGAKKLYAMLDRVQRARGKTTGKNKVAANSRADKYLPA